MPESKGSIAIDVIGILVAGTFAFAVGSLLFPSRFHVETVLYDALKENFGKIDAVTAVTSDGQETPCEIISDYTCVITHSSIKQ